MGVVELRAGARIDLASGAELAELGETLTKKLDSLDYEPTIITPALTVTVDVNGLIGGGAGGPGLELYRAPNDALVTIHRVAIAAIGYTPSAPLAAGWIQTFRNAFDPSALCHETPVPGSTAVIPYIATDGGAAAVRLRHGERYVIAGAGLPAGLVIGVNLHVRLID